MSNIDFDLRQLEIFCRIVELGSFSKAAGVVFLAQASVSERIANLEKSIGTPLLDRLGRKVAPTKAGELLYRHALSLLEMKKTAIQELTAFLGLKQGEIHLGGSTVPGEYILPEALGRFHAKYPQISVVLTIADSSDIANQVLEGRIELGVVGSKDLLPNIAQHELWQDELVLVVPLSHRWAGKEAIASGELVDEPFIMREKGSGTLKIVENYLKVSAPNPPLSLNVVGSLGSSTAVKEGIKSGLGVSILSLRAIETELKTGILRAIRIEDTPMFRSFYLIRDKRRITSPLSQLLIDFLQVDSKEQCQDGC